MSDESLPVIAIDGERIRLGPLRRDLIPTYTRWRNDPRVVLTLTGQLRPATEEWMAHWYEGAARPGDGAVRFLVYGTNYLPVGIVELTGIDLHNRTAGFGLWIGEPDEWGKGYGTEATRLMLRYGFEVIGLHSISLAVHADNERAIRAYTRAGFRPIGRQREVVYRAGRRVDSLLMDCLAREFLGADR